MSREIKIIIPEFVQEMKLADKKRKTYYKRGDEIPNKYAGPKFIWKKDKLYDSIKKEFVIKNPASAGKPRFKSIAGNDIWGRVHPRIRMAAIEAIVNNFKPHLPSRIDLNFPITIDMEVYTPSRYCDWDIGNLWVYDKVFQDLLVESKLIPDDTIRFVTKSSGPRYIPITKNSERKMVFTLREDTDPRVISHVMYDLDRIKPITRFDYKEDAVHYLELRGYEIKLTDQGGPGTILTDEENKIIYISVGKTKKSYRNNRKGFARAFSTVVQLNAFVLIHESIYADAGPLVESEFVARGLKVAMYAKERSEVQDLAPNEVS
jgi:hypothetical protein